MALRRIHPTAQDAIRPIRSVIGNCLSRGCGEVCARGGACPKRLILTTFQGHLDCKSLVVLLRRVKPGSSEPSRRARDPDMGYHHRSLTLLPTKTKIRIDKGAMDDAPRGLPGVKKELVFHNFRHDASFDCNVPGRGSYLISPFF